MNIRKILSDSNEIKQFEQLYLELFPTEERLPFHLLAAKEKEGKGNFLGLFDDDVLAGIIYYTKYKSFIYIFYFAVAPSYQSKGCGKMMLEYMFEQFNDYVIMLLIEPIDEKAANNQQRIRRKNFYLRNGFVENNQFLETLGLDFELLHSRGGTAFVSDYQEIKKAYYLSVS